MIRFSVLRKFLRFIFSHFTGKRKVLELSDVIQAQINLHTAVRLSLKTSLYDLQKPRYVHYDFGVVAIFRATK